MKLEVKNLNFFRGENHILKDISFSVQSGDIVALLGSNGAGKTTLLKSICSLNKPQSGEVLFDDKLITSSKALSKILAFVPQSSTPSNTSVYDSVLLGRIPHMRLFSSKNDLTKTSQTIEALELAHISNKPTNRISGGEFQKVQIARAINQEPSVLILDEPSNNLDIANQHKTLHIVEHIAKDMCMIMSIHDINLAIHYANKFLFLHNGEIRAFGGVECITKELILEVYGVSSDIIDHKGVPFVVPSHSSKYHLESHEHPHEASDHITV